MLWTLLRSMRQVRLPCSRVQSPLQRLPGRRRFVGCTRQDHATGDFTVNRKLALPSRAIHLN